MTRKIINLLLVLAFLFAIIFPSLFSDKIGGKISEVENRYLAEFPAILTQDMKLAPGIGTGLEAWINDNAGGRVLLQRTRSNIDYRLFRVSSNPLVHIGKEGWFYYTGDGDLEIARGTYPVTQELLEKIKDSQVKIQKALSSRGIEYVLVLTPSKGSVYPEYIQGGQFVVRDTLIDIVSDYLRKNTTIPVINTKVDLLEAKKTKIVYYKTDTHWNEAGAYVGYLSIINTLNQYGLINSEAIKVNTYPSEYKGEFSAILGDVNLLPAEPFDATKIISPNAVNVESGEYYGQMQGLMNQNNVQLTHYLYQNNKAEPKRLLIYGDSYFVKWNIIPLLAENFSNLDYVWSDDIRNDVVELSNPDIVIMERTERYLYTLADQVDVTLIHAPLQNPTVEIISHNTPTQVERNGKYEIRITVKNTGQESWSGDRGVSMSIFQDGQDSYRIFLPEGMEINPGDEYTFVFKEFRAPTQNSSTYLEYLMVEEGIQYFGERKQIQIVIK